MNKNKTVGFRSLLVMNLVAMSVIIFAVTECNDSAQFIVLLFCCCCALVNIIFLLHLL
jgi:hypothetical protein